MVAKGVIQGSVVPFGFIPIPGFRSGLLKIEPVPMYVRTWDLGIGIIGSPGPGILRTYHQWTKQVPASVGLSLTVNLKQSLSSII